MYRAPRYIILPYYRDQLLRYFDWYKNKKLHQKVSELPYEKRHIQKLIKEIDNG
jgi:hypothetical protein